MQSNMKKYLLITLITTISLTVIFGSKTAKADSLTVADDGSINIDIKTVAFPACTFIGTEKILFDELNFYYNALLKPESERIDGITSIESYIQNSYSAAGPDGYGHPCPKYNKNPIAKEKKYWLNTVTNYAVSKINSIQSAQDMLDPESPNYMANAPEIPYIQIKTPNKILICGDGNAYNQYRFVTCIFSYKNIIAKTLNGALKLGLNKATKKQQIQYYYDTYFAPLEARIYAAEREFLSKTLSVLPTATQGETVLSDFSKFVSPFPDIDLQTNEGKAAAELFRRGVITAKPNGEFKGSEKVTREELASMLITLHNGISVSTIKNVKASNLLSLHIKGAGLGLAPRPNDQINTIDFLVMLAKVENLPNKLSYNYTDIPANSAMSNYAGIVEKYLLFPGRDTISLQPAKKLTRSELAIALYQYLKEK